MLPVVTPALTFPPPARGPATPEEACGTSIRQGHTNAYFSFLHGRLAARAVPGAGHSVEHSCSESPSLRFGDCGRDGRRSSRNGASVAWRGREVVYVWADGIYVKAGLERDKAALLVVLGAMRDGTKEVLALRSGYRESVESWSEVLRDLKARGIEAPRLLMADGNAAIWGAVRQVWPEAGEQRCWNHKMRNVLDDVIIRNGRVIDGTGNPWFLAEVALDGDRIAAVGDLGAATEL